MKNSESKSYVKTENPKSETIIFLWIPFILLYLYCLFLYSYFALAYLICGAILLNFSLESYYCEK